MLVISFKMSNLSLSLSLSLHLLLADFYVSSFLSLLSSLISLLSFKFLHFLRRFRWTTPPHRRPPSLSGDPLLLRRTPPHAFTVKIRGRLLLRVSSSSSSDCGLVFILREKGLDEKGGVVGFSLGFFWEGGGGSSGGGGGVARRCWRC
ncbi:hypothetical protein HanRHA438_Chr13g0588771 [Helianthus annuus]|nr:hypothetical protein HanRHA438_Chr13g0588771 [Helianthus annuus]